MINNKSTSDALPNSGHPNLFQLGGHENLTKDASGGSTPPLLLTIPEASAALRISRWMVYRLIHTRQLSTIKIGRRRCVPVASLQAFVDQLRNAESA